MISADNTHNDVTVFDGYYEIAISLKMHAMRPFVVKVEVAILTEALMTLTVI
jgi:hypothetical protein